MNWKYAYKKLRMKDETEFILFRKESWLVVLNILQRNITLHNLQAARVNDHLCPRG